MLSNNKELQINKDIYHVLDITGTNPCPSLRCTCCKIYISTKCCGNIYEDYSKNEHVYYNTINNYKNNFTFASFSDSYDDYDTSYYVKYTIMEKYNNDTSMTDTTLVNGCNNISGKIYDITKNYIDNIQCRRCKLHYCKYCFHDPYAKCLNCKLYIHFDKYIYSYIKHNIDLLNSESVNNFYVKNNVVESGIVHHKKNLKNYCKFNKNDVIQCLWCKICYCKNCFSNCPINCVGGLFVFL
jgi:hypothetical protein